MRISHLPLTLAASLVALTASTQASAETFKGPYVGVTAGYDRVEIDSSIETAPLDAEATRDSFVFGGYVGYNYKVADNVVIGAEAGLTTTTDDRVVATSGGQSLTIDPRYSFDLSARAGYLVTDKALVYLRGGYANQRARASVDNQSFSENLDGWQVGGGVEYAITDNISVRGEYRYSDFGQDGASYDRHQALIGVSYNF